MQVYIIDGNQPISRENMVEDLRVAYSNIAQRQIEQRIKNDVLDCFSLDDEESEA